MLSEPLLQLLATLAESEAEFIIVGGTAAVLQEVPVVTFDVDIVHRRSPENIERLMSALAELDAYIRPDFAKRRLQPRADDLAGHGHILLQTRHGQLDVLCELVGKRGYEDLLPHTIPIEEGGLRLRVLDLPMVAQVKAEVGRPKDLLAVPLILAAYEERKRRG